MISSRGFLLPRLRIIIHLVNPRDPEQRFLAGEDGFGRYLPLEIIGQSGHAPGVLHERVVQQLLHGLLDRGIQQLSTRFPFRAGPVCKFSFLLRNIGQTLDVLRQALLRLRSFGGGQGFRCR